VGFQDLAYNFKRTRRVEQPMHHLLFDQIDVQHSAQGLRLLLLLFPALLNTDPSALGGGGD
jgi:hypothetical protein